MLTIGELAAYAGVTTRAVRHYHQIGLLPEPERDASGYRDYDARAVVELIRIRTLAEAGVPLARVKDLLGAGDAEFAEAVAGIDRRLRAEIRQLQEHRRRIARLAAGDSLALPTEAVDYLDRLRASGVPEAVVEGERDAWILIAARWPERMADFMADKQSQLADPRALRFYRLIGEMLETGLDEERLAEAADLLGAMTEQAAASGELDRFGEEMADDGFVALLDSYASEAHPLIVRLQELMVERGWAGWTRMERADGPRAAGDG